GAGASNVKRVADRALSLHPAPECRAASAPAARARAGRPPPHCGPRRRARSPGPRATRRTGPQPHRLAPSLARAPGAAGPSAGAGRAPRHPRANRGLTAPGAARCAHA
nr:hypothetical protein [Tanacetum cinerariifolium]